jgi:hypothetical protein
VVLHVLLEHCDQRLELRARRRAAAQFLHQVLERTVLDLRLVHEILVVLAQHLARGGIEHLLLDGGVRAQRLADAAHDLHPRRIAARALELREQRVDFAMIGLEQGNGIGWLGRLDV